MPMNRVQFQPGLSMPEFLGRFGSGCRVSARDTCRGLLLPTGLAQWRQLILCRGRPAVAAALHTAERHSALKCLDGVSDCALHLTSAGYRDLRPLRHCGHTHTPTPSADYRPSLSLSLAGSDCSSSRSRCSRGVGL
jgi:hypothetical protein